MDMNPATSGRVHPCISNAQRIDAGGFRDVDRNTGGLTLSVFIAGNNSRWHQPPGMAGCTYFCSMEATARIWTSDTNPGWLDHQTWVSSTDQSIQNDIRIEVCRLQVHHNILLELTGTRPWRLDAFSKHAVKNLQHIELRSYCIEELSVRRQDNQVHWY